jgi:hypothetical protein
MLTGPARKLNFFFFNAIRVTPAIAVTATTAVTGWRNACATVDADLAPATTAGAAAETIEGRLIVIPHQLMISL